MEKGVLLQAAAAAATLVPGAATSAAQDKFAPAIRHFKTGADATGRSAGTLYTTWAGFKDCTEGDCRFVEDFGPSPSKQEKK